MPEAPANLDHEAPAMATLPAALAARLHGITCELCITADTLAQAAAIVEDAANSDDPPPLLALVRLIRAVGADVNAAHAELDRISQATRALRVEAV